MGENYKDILYACVVVYNISTSEFHLFLQQLVGPLLSRRLSELEYLRLKAELKPSNWGSKPTAWGSFS